MVRHLHDIAGGAVATAPSFADLENPETGAFVQKYMRGVAGVTAEYRLALFHAIRDITADAYGGWQLVTKLQSGGGLYAQRIVTRQHYDMVAATNAARALVAPRLMSDQPVAVVTGGTKGIGRAIVERLLTDGWSVLATYLHDEGNAQRFAELHETLSVLRADVGSAADCERAVGAALERFGQLDHLVNVAGITRNALLRELTDEDWEAVLTTNLSGPFRMCRAAADAIAASPRGRIVTVSSVAAEMGNVNQGAYAASKAGLVGFTRTLAREVARSGTTVNLVVPGPTADTGITVDFDPAFVAAIARKIPMHRLGRPEETAHAVRFLLDDLAAYNTGSIVVVDGGLSM